MTFNQNISGRFMLEVEGPDKVRRVAAGWQPNLITNAGLDRFGTNGPLESSASCFVGSGNTLPAFTDTALQALVGSTTQSQDLVGGAPTLTDEYGYLRRTYIFQPGVAAGNLSEIGIGWTSPSTGLFTRALIKDGNGDPTTITILPNETLFVTYEMRLYQLANDVTGSIVLGGTTYNYTARSGGLGYSSLNQPPAFDNTFAGGANFYSGGALGNKFESPSGTYRGPASTNSVAAYVLGSYNSDFTIGLGASNITVPFNLIYFGTFRGSFQVLFDQPIPKSDLNEFSMTFRIGWSRRV